jgi:hypothetical protein
VAFLINCDSPLDEGIQFCESQELEHLISESMPRIEPIRQENQNESNFPH